METEVRRWKCSTTQLSGFPRRGRTGTRRREGREEGEERRARDRIIIVKESVRAFSHIGLY